MMLLYSALLAAGLLASSPLWAYRMLAKDRYREGLRERLGRVPQRLRRAAAGHRVVWIHAVSVGEVLAAARLVEELQTALNAAGPAVRWQTVISTTTRTGQRLARQRFGEDRVFWFPLDFAFAVRSWLQALQPAGLVLVESELWPRLLAECVWHGIPVAVVNARISDRSFRRATRLRPLWRRVLRRVSLFLAQGSESAQRLVALGVDIEKIQQAGNLKYDLATPPTAILRSLRPLLERRTLVVAGSLLAPEEELLLTEWRALCRNTPEALLLLAPRHPERFDEVARLVDRGLILFRASSLLQQRNQGSEPVRLPPFSVILLDTVGDLAAIYALADVAFVGGSLARKGGHNPLEPARFGIPTLMGPSFENFREVVESLRAEEGIEIVQNAAELGRALSRLMADRVAADALGQRGQRVFERHKGATARSVDALVALLQGPSSPDFRSPDGPKGVR